MIYRVEIGPHGVKSCVEVEAASTGDKGRVFYVEADSKETAIRAATLQEVYDKWCALDHADLGNWLYAELAELMGQLNGHTDLASRIEKAASLTHPKSP